MLTSGSLYRMQTYGAGGSQIIEYGALRYIDVIISPLVKNLVHVSFNSFKYHKSR
jgi:hypothetical protein